MPGGTHRNWNSYGEKVNLKSQAYKSIVCDPQTSGGLLLAVRPEKAADVENLLVSKGIKAESFGELTKAKECLITVY